MTPEMTEVLNRALITWGKVPQMLQTVEECAELQQALIHHIRGRATAQDVAGEVADVLIMAHQMRLMFGPEAVDEALGVKLARLDGRIRAAA